MSLKAWAATAESYSVTVESPPWRGDWWRQGYVTVAVGNQVWSGERSDIDPDDPRVAAVRALMAEIAPLDCVDRSPVTEKGV